MLQVKLILVDTETENIVKESIMQEWSDDDIAYQSFIELVNSIEYEGD